MDRMDIFQWILKEVYMVYKYDRSEAFRANAFFYTGFALCGPLGVDVLNMLNNRSWKWDWGYLLVELAISTLGYLLIQESYFIMKKRDDYNDYR